MKRGHEPKTTLDPLEKLKAAYAYEILGVEQHVIAALYGINSGRIAEAIAEVRKAVGIPSTKH
jgi:hypothetical protein